MNADVWAISPYGYWESPESARLAKKVRYGKAKRTLQNKNEARRKSTTVIIRP